MNKPDIKIYLTPKVVQLHIEKGDYDQLEAITQIVYKFFPRTKYYKKLLFNAYEKLANQYQEEGLDYKVIEMYLWAVSLSKRPKKYVNLALDNIVKLINRNSETLIQRDFDYLTILLTYLKTNVFSTKSIDQELRRINNLCISSPSGTESQHTSKLQGLCNNCLMYLDEEQVDNITNLLAPYLSELLKELEAIKAKQKAEKLKTPKIE
jgi:hypothetical protein